MGWKSILATIAPLALSAIPGIGPALGMSAKAAGILGKVGSIAGAMSPILSSAAGAKAKANAQTEVNQVPRDQLNQNAAIANNKLPGERLATGARASYAAAGPVKVGALPTPGWGTRGEAGPSWTGGGNAPLDPRIQKLSSSVMDQELQNQLTGGDKVPGATAPPPSSMADKLLTGASLGSSILGGLSSMGKSASSLPPGINVGSAGRSTGPDLGMDPNQWLQYLKQKSPSLMNPGTFPNPSLLTPSGGF